MTDRSDEHPSVPPRLHFFGFNTLRFLAATAVFLYHLDLQKDPLLLPRMLSPKMAASLGGAGVDLFFVLSGFLITYLILAQIRDTKGDFGIRNFYIRRALRIQPLYICLVILAYFPGRWFVSSSSLPVDRYIRVHQLAFSQHWIRSLILYMVMLPNVAVLAYPTSIYASQCWSIGVEEQYYLIWPWAIRWAGSFRRMVTLCVVYITVVVACSITMIMLRCRLPPGSACLERWNTISKWVGLMNMSGLALGSLFAVWLFFRRESVVSTVSSEWIRKCWLPLIVLFMATRSDHWRLLSMMGYGIVILNMAIDRHAENRYPRMTEYLGKVSYGMYMYHPAAILFSLWGIQALTRWRFPVFFNLHQNISTVVLVFSSFGITLGLSLISYGMIERPFLELKASFGSVSRM